MNICTFVELTHCTQKQKPEHPSYVCGDVYTYTVSDALCISTLTCFFYDVGVVHTTCQ